MKRPDAARQNPERVYEIKIGSREFEIRGDFKTIKAIERQVGGGVYAALQALMNGQLTVEQMAGLVKAALGAQARDLSTDDIGAELMAAGLARFTTTFSAFLMGLWLGHPETPKGEEGAEHDPLPRPTGPDS